MTTPQDKRTDYLGQIQDLVSTINPYREPFLHFLPELLMQADFKNIDMVKALRFTQLGLQSDEPPIIADAKKILNQIVSSDGTLATPSLSMFYENHSFFWKELGGHTKPIDVISHILNKSMMVASISQY